MTPPDDRKIPFASSFDFPGLHCRRASEAWWILLALSLAYSAVAWGHIISISGDVSIWLHQVERFAHGEAPYRDYYWEYPPMAMWLLGGITKLLGPKLQVIWTATALIFLLICYGYYRYVSALLRKDLVLPVLLAGFFLSIPYAQMDRAPLPIVIDT